ncbi:MAG: hypothetical protein JWN28_11 [Candidatus Saccharibacteria bacterium]|nr:hypothetical protein [Candidatus Saccharibacteria bacterium]
MKTHRNKAEEERQIRLVKDWIETRPVPPTGKEPSFPAAWYLGLPVLFAVIGFIVGGFYFDVIFGPGKGMLEPEEARRFLAPFVGAFLAILFAWPVLMILLRIFHSRLRRSGWPEYRKALHHWKLIGSEDFGDWAYSNYTVAALLSVIDDSYWSRPKAAEQEKRQREATKQYLDDDLGDLERRLDNATPGPVSTLTPPSPRKLRRSARYYGKLKRTTESDKERFIVQFHFMMERSVGVNSAGWISSSTVVDESEKTALIRQVRKVYEAQGLRVSKCWIAWRGMESGGPSGSREFFALVIRLA